MKKNIFFIICLTILVLVFASCPVPTSYATIVVTPPVANDNLVFTGVTMELVKSGSVSKGIVAEFLYSMDGGISYSTDIPTADKPGEYTIYWALNLSSKADSFNLSGDKSGSLNVQVNEALPGEFTVDKNGKKVQFSSGNLYYSANTDTWAFEENQFDYRTYYKGGSIIGGKYASNPKGDVGLFYWTDRAEYSVADHVPEDYTLTLETKFFVNEPEIVEEQWKCLTQAEWSYLFLKRNNAASKKGLATIITNHENRVNGLVILPDTFYMPSNCSFLPASTAAKPSYIDNVYTYSQWSEMQKAGAVFLAATGSRDYEDGWVEFNCFDAVNFYTSTLDTYNGEICAYLMFADQEDDDVTWLKYQTYNWYPTLGAQAVRLVKYL